MFSHLSKLFSDESSIVKKIESFESTFERLITGYNKFSEDFIKMKHDIKFLCGRKVIEQNENPYSWQSPVPLPINDMPSLFLMEEKLADAEVKKKLVSDFKVSLFNTM